MSKIQTIKIQNFKAIGEFEADFKGCTAIITAGNNMGKTSFLRGIPDRIRFVRPDVMVKKGATVGKGEMTLTTGEKFIWEFDNEGKDKLVYITDKGISSKVTVEIGQKFFPATFDIDKFLQSPPKKQSAQLQQILGIDFTEIDARYQSAYDDRTEKNRDAERYHAKLIEMLEVPKAEFVDLTALQGKKETERSRLNNLYADNKAHNDKLRNDWNAACRQIDAHCQSHNEETNALTAKKDKAVAAACILVELGYEGKEVASWIGGIVNSILPLKIAADLYAVEPTYIDEMPDDSTLKSIDDEILQASLTNQKAQEYKNYLTYKQSVENAKDIAKEADELVKSIEAERETLIQTAKFPKGIAITPDGITVDGFPLDRNQISTSKLYTTALRIASMNLGEVKTLYFDASFLDRNSLAEIEAWASDNDLQLLIERPDFDGGEIKYELIEEIPQVNAVKEAA